jgi:hypothetical protein
MLGEGKVELATKKPDYKKMLTNAKKLPIEGKLDVLLELAFGALAGLE